MGDAPGERRDRLHFLSAAQLFFQLHFMSHLPHDRNITDGGIGEAAHRRDIHVNLIAAAIRTLVHKAPAPHRPACYGLLQRPMKIAIHLAAVEPINAGTDHLRPGNAADRLEGGIDVQGRAGSIEDQHPIGGLLNHRRQQAILLLDHFLLGMEANAVDGVRKIGTQFFEKSDLLLVESISFRRENDQPAEDLMVIPQGERNR